MSNVFFISDLHWGHRAITKYRTEFSSEEEHRLTIKENILSTVNKRALLWILGDSVMDKNCLQDIADIPCRKYLTIGNHCAEHFNQWELYKHFDKVFGITKKYGCWISHAPIHPDELRGKFCLHGHTHRHIIDDLRYINMCVENHDYKPRDLNWLRNEMERRNEKINTTYSYLP